MTIKDPSKNQPEYKASDQRNSKLDNVPKDTPRLPETGFIRLRQVLALIPVSQSTWWAGVASGRFPKPFNPTPRTSAWRCEDIRKLIENISRVDD